MAVGSSLFYLGFCVLFLYLCQECACPNLLSISSLLFDPSLFVIAVSMVCIVFEITNVHLPANNIECILIIEWLPYNVVSFTAMRIYMGPCYVIFTFRAHYSLYGMEEYGMLFITSQLIQKSSTCSYSQNSSMPLVMHDS